MSDIPDEADALVLEWCRPGAVHERGCFTEELFGPGYIADLCSYGWLAMDHATHNGYVTTPEGLAALDRRYAARGRG